MNQKRKPSYTNEQIEVIAQNPYTHSITPHRMTFTLEFKEFFVDQVKNHGLTAPKVLKAAGYDPKMFSRTTIEFATRIPTEIPTAFMVMMFAV